MDFGVAIKFQGGGLRPTHRGQAGGGDREGTDFRSDEIGIRTGGRHPVTAGLRRRPGVCRIDCSPGPLVAVGEPGEPCGLGGKGLGVAVIHQGGRFRPSERRQDGWRDGEVLARRTRIVRIRAGGRDGVIPGVHRSGIRGSVACGAPSRVGIGEPAHTGCGGQVRLWQTVKFEGGRRRPADRWKPGGLDGEGLGCGTIIVGILADGCHPVITSLDRSIRTGSNHCATVNPFIKDLPRIDSRSEGGVSLGQAGEDQISGRRPVDSR